MHTYITVSLEYKIEHLSYITIPKNITKVESDIDSLKKMNPIMPKSIVQRLRAGASAAYGAQCYKNLYESIISLKKYWLRGVSRKLSGSNTVTYTYIYTHIST